MNWYSSKLRFAVIVEDLGLQNYMDSLVLFRANDFDTAFAKALQIGLANEEEYRNGEAKIVRWKLAEVVSLDLIEADSLEGVEVYSEPLFKSDPSIGIEHKFQPEMSKPAQSI